MQRGEVIADRFEIERLAGSGGMGQVFRARDRVSGEPVAIKVLHITGELEIERFAREAEVLSTLHHPGIVRYIGGGATRSGAPYLAMEWLEGEPLSERLKREPLTFAESLALGRRAASALAAVHERSVVHRDIKPSNLFLRGGSIEAVTLIDFGLARRLGPQLTLPGSMLGTPGYIAPEQALGDPDLDARADVFSLGCVLFRCFGGRAPFQGRDALSVLLKVAADEPPLLREIRPSIPGPLDDLVTRMLAKARDARPRDGREVARALQAIEESPSFASGAVRSSTEITGVERRVVCLVLARPDERAEATLPAAEAGSRERALRAVVERHHGVLETLADGSRLVLLTSADAATDLATHAARCALAMRSQLERGPIVIASGRETLGPHLPTGDLIDRAVQLLGTATGSGAIRIDEVTHGLIGTRFDVEVDGARLVLRGERSEPDGQRPLCGKPTACIGREHELVQLEGLFDLCKEERMATAVLLTGAAGMGKSRLTHEFVRHIRARGEPVQIWRAEGDSMSAGSAFSLLAQALRRAAGLVDDGAPLSDRRRQLGDHVARRLGGSRARGADAARIADLLGEIAGVSFASDGDAALRALRQDPVALGEQMRVAFLTFLRAECATQPVLLVLEDLQWGDVPTVRFVDSALDELREAPFMVLATARPEVHALFPRLWVARGAQELRVRPLSRRASERLVRQVLGDDIAKHTMNALVDRADGHAFYLEELIRAVADGKGAELPETVLAMIQARLERLDPEARRVLRAASLFGETFWRGGVEALFGASGAEAWLAELVEREMIAPHEHSRFPAEAEYGFRHALVREAAYAMLTDSDRVLGHRLAGAWLEQAGEKNAMVLAEHYERGEVRDRAVAWFTSAVQHALEGGDFDAVVACSQRGLACGAEGTTRGALLSMMGYVHEWRGQYVEAARVHREALPDLARGGARWCQSIGGALYAGAAIGDVVSVSDLIEALRDGLAQAEGTLPPVAGMSAAVPILCIAGEYRLARAFIERFSMAGGDREGDLSIDDTVIDMAWCHYAHFAEGDPWALRRHAAASLARGELLGEPRVIHMAQAYEGLALVNLGATEAGERLLREAREGAAEHGLHLVQQFADLFLAGSLTSRLALDEAEALLEACRSTASQSALWGPVWSIASARVARRRRDFDRAMALARGALEVFGRLSPGYAANALGILAVVEMERGGDLAVAVNLARDSLVCLDTVGTCHIDTALRVWNAEVLHAAGDHGGAVRALTAALAAIEARAAAIEDADLRASFLANIPENARALELAPQWLPGR